MTDSRSPFSAGPQISPRYQKVISERQSALRRQIDDFISAGDTLTLEVGSGHGHFLTAYAQAHPEKVCVGVDLIGERVERAGRKRDRSDLKNLHFLHAEARMFVAQLPATVSFSEIFVLFPDPWPKLRHHKHRIMQSGFLRMLGERATAKCRLYFRTDHEPYFAATRAIVDAHPDWRLSEAPWPFEYQTVFQSRASMYHSLAAERRS
jgi:tRNA (guanine-N7-)-methyltransferase